MNSTNSVVFVYFFLHLSSFPCCRNSAPLEPLFFTCHPSGQSCCESISTDLCSLWLPAACTDSGWHGRQTWWREEERREDFTVRNGKTVKNNHLSTDYTGVSLDTAFPLIIISWEVPHTYFTQLCIPKPSAYSLPSFAFACNFRGHTYIGIAWV